jgi:hypothetical protein
MLRVLMTLAAMFVLVFSLITAVYAYRSDIRLRKTWAFIAILGTPVTIMNWRTGTFVTRALSVQVLGVGAVRPGSEAPWFLRVAFPMGAVLFRTRRRALIAAHRPLRSDDQIT